MAKNKNVSIKIGSDTKEAEKGINSVTSKLNKLNKQIKSNDVSKLTSSFKGLAATITPIVATIAETLKGIKDVTDAYNTQLKAETQLANAIKNNPYIDGTANQRMKDFASSIQSVTTYGDEALMPLMAQLINTGRTEQEVMDIISASVDIAASGAMSLESAVDALNKTYTGTAGTLGKTSSKIKALTADELKNGEAVKIMAEMYKGTASEVAKMTGSYEQLTNAAGDFKEALGSITKPSADLWNNFWKGFYENGIEVINNINTFLDENISGKEVAKAFVKAADNIDKSSDSFLKATYIRDSLVKLSDEELKYSMGYLENKKRLSDQEAFILEQMKLQKNERETLLKLDTQRAKLLEEEKKKQEELAEAQRQSEAAANLRNSSAQNMIDNTKKSITQQEKALEINAKLSDIQVDNAERLKIYTQAYVSLISQSGGLISENNSYAKELLKKIEQIASTVESVENIDGEDSWLQERLDYINSLSLEDTISELEQQIKVIDNLITEAQRNEVELESAIWQEYYDKRAEMEEKLQQLIKEKNEENLKNVLSTISEFVSAAQQIATSIASVITTGAEANEKTQLAKLEDQFDKGLIAEDEYYNQKEQIEKEYAQKEYEAQMWEWTSSIAQIGVSTAQAIVNALSNSGHPAIGIAMASVMGALGAAQLSAAIASKPVAPSFATGGIVPGHSYSGDKIQANVNSGEMILNAKQQAALWSMANSGNSGNSGNSPNISIRNYAGNDVSVTPQVSDSDIKFMIRSTVAKDMREGAYNSSLSQAQSTINGVRYTS